MIAGRLFVEALRLDRWSASKVREVADRAVDLEVGGFILFGGAAQEVSRLTRSLVARAGRPLWLAADLERGPGQQFAGAVELPPPAALAAHDDPETAVRIAARLTARGARDAGVNLVLAPVLDLDIETRNPIVATRSFGRDPARVGQLGTLWINELQRHGVAGCAKHFPGHGRTVADSHVELPVVAASAADLEADLAPFRAVAGSAAATMASHVAYPALGARGPATLSRSVLFDLLRGELAFRGLIVTDAMIMDGLYDGGRDPDEVAVAAVAAGCDLLVYPPRLADQVMALQLAIESDASIAERAADAIARSEGALAQFGGPSPENPRPENGTGALSDATGGADSPSAAEAALSLACACVRTVGSPTLDGWSRETATDVIPISDDPDDDPPGHLPELGSALVAELEEAGWQSRTPGDSGTPGEQRLVVVRATPRGWKRRAGLSEEAAARIRALLNGARALPVLLGHPRQLEDLGAAGICAWSGETVMERAAARWLDARLG